MSVAATGPPSGRDLAVGLPGALATGGFIAAQGRITGQLGSELGDGVLAALISFGLGLVLLLMFAPLTTTRAGLRRAFAAGRAGRLRPWQFLGGLGGAALVTCQGVTVGALGIALFTVAVVAGQSAGGLAADRAGLGVTGVQPLTTPRVAGAVLMLGAVALSVAPSLTTSVPVALALLPLVAGVATAVQQAFNGRVAAAAGAPAATGPARSILGSVVPAATTNFVVGTVALALAAAVSVATQGLPAGLPTTWWLYLGGPLGALFIGLATWVVSHVGVLLFSLGAVAGQVLCALAIDTVVPSAAGVPGTTTMLGAGLTVVAAGVASLPARRRQRSPVG